MAGFTVDGEALDESALAPEEYTTEATYDALNRVSSLVYPEAAGAGLRVLRPEYNRAGALEQVELEGPGGRDVYVERIGTTPRADGGARAFVGKKGRVVLLNDQGRVITSEHITGNQLQNKIRSGGWVPK